MESALEAASLHPAQLLGLEKTKGNLDFGADAGEAPYRAQGGGSSLPLLLRGGPTMDFYLYFCVYRHSLVRSEDSLL